VKYDKKTGEKEPECRMDEIKLSLEQLSNLQKQSNGLIDREFENNLILKDISVSLGLVVDILGTLYNRMFSKDKEQPKQ
jgi:hypothetical protein